ncbi:MAG: T9SS type A sorting domain-containing protein [Bacteroidetes bacterium]|nr:T9SS type A sorting domain-containing protein [Bacteroidota bacterium]
MPSHPNGETGVLYRNEPGSLSAYVSHILRIDANGVVIGQTGLSDNPIGCSCESLHGMHGGGYVANGLRIPSLFAAPVPCVFKSDGQGTIARTVLNGYLYVDENLNNIKDAAESSVPYQQLNFEPDFLPAYSSSVGYYARNFYALDSVKIQAATPDFFVQSYPDTSLYAFIPDTLDGSVHSLDVALKIVESVEEYEIVLTGTDAIPGFAYQSWITCKNRGSVFDDTVFIDYVLPPSTTFAMATPAPYAMDVDTLRFALQFSDFFEDQQINLVLQLEPDITLLGDTLWSEARIAVPASDYLLSNNRDWEGHWVRAAYDPNQKTVEPAGLGPGYVADTTEWLTYTIEFQNTGTYPASLVRLVDELPAQVLPESLEFLGSSHEPVVLHLENSHTAVWTFDPILLPDSSSDLLGSMGYVKFRVRPLPDLDLGTVIRNRAQIYFDFNPPISTAFTNTIWGIPETNAVAEALNSPPPALLIFPNPATETAYVFNIPDQAVLLSLVSSTGNVLFSKRQTLGQQREELSLANLPNGYYYVLIYTNKALEKAVGRSLVIQR